MGRGTGIVSMMSSDRLARAGSWARNAVACLFALLWVGVGPTARPDENMDPEG